MVELENYDSYDNDGNNDLITEMVWYNGIGGCGGSSDIVNDGAGGGDNTDMWGKWGGGGSSNRIDNDSGSMNSTLYKYIYTQVSISSLKNCLSLSLSAHKSPYLFLKKLRISLSLSLSLHTHKHTYIYLYNIIIQISKMFKIINTRIISNTRILIMF